MDERLGVYQKRILWRLRQNPVSSKSLESGFSLQVKSLSDRGLIRKKSDKYYITKKGEKECQIGQTN